MSKNVYESFIKDNPDIPLYVRSLIKFLYINDYESFVHSYRVFNFCKNNIEKTKIKKELHKDVIYGTLLHDIGKSIDTGISNIPERFEYPIRESFHFHCVFGYMIMQDINPLIAKICLRHHDTEYLKDDVSLNSEEIEIIRFIKFCDILDALTSKRAYKNKYSKEQALKIIKAKNDDISCFIDIIE